MNREQTAAAAGVNAHYISDTNFILKHGSSEMLDRLRDGTLGMQEALRTLGRVTQRDRNRARTQTVLRLCEAVLGEDAETARILAAEIVLAHAKRKKVG